MRQARSIPASFYQKLLDSLYDGVYFVDQERRITYWNQGAQSLTGYSKSEALGRKCFDNFLQHVDFQGCALCQNGCPLSETMSDGRRREAELYLSHKNGHRVPVSIRVAPLLDGTGRVIGAVEVFTDVTEKKKIERRVDELEDIAFHDSLTGLLNRRYIELKVSQAVSEYQHVGRSYGVLIIDVDHFKAVNDKNGHEAGDRVLRAVSQTLIQSLRAFDIVGRWGGEEFLVLLADTTEVSLVEVAERCRRLVAKSSVVHEGQRLSVTVSIGGTLVHTSDTAESAVRRADELMYLSKRAGRNQTTTD
jgi:diguanylate cyclase (GGDEF)-like protein/PAS domain S-box-containing protein